MNKLLLDTHALIWWWLDDPQLSAAARLAIHDAESEVLVSAATAWGIMSNQRLGKLPECRQTCWPIARRCCVPMVSKRCRSAQRMPCAPEATLPRTAIPSTGCWPHRQRWRGQ